MPPIPNYNDPEDEVVVGRRSSRLSIVLPITIRGIDVTGQAFKENTWTIGVNKHGAKLATFHQLAQGDQISIENPVLGRSAKARVVRVGEKRFPEDPYEIGVELLEAQNIWGVRYPPEDWQRGRPPIPITTVSEKPPEPQVPPLVRKPAVAPPGKIPEEPQPRAEAGERLAEARAEPEKFNQFKAAMAALAQYAKQAEETGEARAGISEERAPRPPSQLDLQIVTGLTEAASRLEEKEKAARALEERLALLADRLQATRPQFEELLAKLQAEREAWELDTKARQRRIREATWESLRAAIEEIDQRVRKHAEEVASSSAEEVRRRLQEEVARAVEALSREAGARLGAVTEEYLSKTVSELQARRTEATQQAKAETERAVRLAATELGEKLQSLAADLVPSLRQGMVASLEDLTERTISRLTASFREKLEAASRAAENSLEQDLRGIQVRIQEEIARAGERARETCREEALGATQVIAEGARDAVGSLNRALEEARAKLLSAYQDAEARVRESRQQLEGFSATMLEDFRRRKDAEMEAFLNELERARSDLVEQAIKDASDRLRRTAEELLEALAKQLQEQVEDSAVMLGDELKTEGGKLVEETKAELRALADSTLASFRGQLDVSSQQSRDLFRKAVEEFHEAAARQMEALLPGLVERQREAIRKALEDELDNFTQRMATRIKSRSDQVVLEASERVHKQVGEAALLLKDWTDEARRRLEAYFEKLTEAFQKQVAEVSAAALERHRQAAETLTNELRARLREVSPSVAEKGVEPSEPRGSSESLLEASSRRFRQETGEALESVIERLKEKHRRALDEAIRGLPQQALANLREPVPSDRREYS